MNWKGALLIVLVLFATATISFAYGGSIQSISQKSQHVDEDGYVQTCNAIPVEPTEEIDTPGGPTKH
jgi:hypothetical protein